MGDAGSGCTVGAHQLSYNCNNLASYDVTITVRMGEVWFGTPGCGQLHVADSIGMNPFYVYLGTNNDGKDMEVQWNSLHIDAVSSVISPPQWADQPSPAPTIASQFPPQAPPSITTPAACSTEGLRDNFASFDPTIWVDASKPNQTPQSAPSQYSFTGGHLQVIGEMQGRKDLMRTKEMFCAEQHDVIITAHITKDRAPGVQCLNGGKCHLQESTCFMLAISEQRTHF